MAEATPEQIKEEQESASPASPAPDSDAPAVAVEDKPAAETPSESDAAPSSDDKPAAEKPGDSDADGAKPAEAESSDAKPSEPTEADGSESQPKSETADGEPGEGGEKPKPRRKKKASSDSEGEDEDDDDTPPPPPKSKPPTKAPPPPPPKVYDVPPDTWSSAPVSNRVWEVDEQEEYDAPQEEEIDLSDSPIGNFYDVGAELGRGFYAVVKTVTEKSSKNQFALKIVNKQLAPQFSGAVKSELDILAKFNHDNILRGEKFFESDQYLLVVLELAKGGEVSQLIANSNSYTEATAHHLVKQLASAVAHIHQQGVIHGDLSPENLLLATPDLGSVLKLAGFSGSIIRSGDLENQQLIGNAEFQPPEVITNQGFNQSADLWSLGCLIFYLLNGASPFKDSNTMRMNMKIRQAKIEFDETWNSISASAKDLISKLVVVDSKARLSGADVLNHPWLSSSPPSTPLPHVKNNITNP